MAIEKWNGRTIRTEDGYLTDEAMQVFRKRLEEERAKSREAEKPAKKTAKKPEKKSAKKGSDFIYDPHGPSATGDV